MIKSLIKNISLFDFQFQHFLNLYSELNNKLERKSFKASKSEEPRQILFFFYFKPEISFQLIKISTKSVVFLKLIIDF